MKLLINIPREFEQHFQTDRFEDSLHRLSADAHLLAGNYEQETAIMLIEAFKTAIPTTDVAERKRGTWIYKHRHRGGFRQVTGIDAYGEMHTVTVDERFEINDPYCPFCGKLNESVFLNFCPNCGADMRGER